MKRRDLVFSVAVAFSVAMNPVALKAETDEVVIEQELDVIDTTKPVLEGIKNQSVFVGDKINYLKGVTAWDDKDGNLTKEIKVDSAKVNLKKAGKYVVTYTVKDSEGNTAIKKAAIQVKKDKAPVIKGARNQTIYLNNPISYRKGVTAKDDKDGNLTKKIKIDSSRVKKAKVGKYPVTYTVKDSAGHKTIKKVFVTVKKFKLFTPTVTEGKEVTVDTKPGGKKNIGTW
ncbi:immunoglobulin-like domain-containing protein [[Clostridium] polysaccharolyticum]|uniref:Pesticidal crystal protein Cry22Aa Ig-like domain-containing protein n=1 Tax=[Clostridium] polysaccharolyticum TaxID=29364 RepID=A0A1H9Y9C7_9FIRM|nr:immunoglobulin-like domain-containing protein [[Clostridium] polysaccharolyticum]SES65379.1 hypothetical protein SAMN04487772_101224 [[Clostridium] polysaccharolyticum]